MANVTEANESPLPAVAALLSVLSLGFLIIGLLAIIGGSFTLRGRR